MDKKFMTITDVANSLNVSDSTVRRWVSAGKLVGQRAGVQWRFDPSVVSRALDQGLLSGASKPMSKPHSLQQYNEPLEWARPLLLLWRQFLDERLKEIQPDQVIVNDRRGAKIWSLIMQGRYSWGSNLWHSTAVEIMTRAELQRIFGRRRVLLFDEMMQHGREMHELRQRLEAKDIDAIVTSVVCVRRRSHAESGELLEYQAIPCEDLDDKMFMERAAAISRLVHLYEPPLDVDHLVVRGSLTPGLTLEAFFENMAKWGIPFVVWFPDKEHNFMAITLDRPQFFDTGNIPLSNGFSFSWAGPCKLRFYVSPGSRVCDCSFIVYPDVEAPRLEWAKTSVAIRKSKELHIMKNASSFSSTDEDELSLRRVYWTICIDIALKLLNDFVSSGAAEDIGVHLDSSRDAVNVDQLRATFGWRRGDVIAKHTREIIARAERTKDLFYKMDQKPLPLLIREKFEAQDDSCDVFKCRREFLEKIPQGYSPDDSSSQQIQSISYKELLYELSHYSEADIGRVLDYELDRGTIKPLIKIDTIVKDGVQSVSLGRGFCRGEFGVWFEWGRNVFTDRDMVIQRTLGLGPTVVEAFLKRTGERQMIATHFDKTFANVQHDLREGVHDLLYIGWRPYKYGPIPVVDARTPSGEFMEFQRFLVNMGCLTENKERHGSQIWRRYEPAGDSEVPWRNLYKERTSAVTKAHLAGLVRLYTAIQRGCTTVRSSDPRSSGLSILQDPLVVLATARNNNIAYICGWFEVRDWRAQGEQILFPLLNAVALNEKPPAKPFLKGHLEEFAAPARLLFDKIEMYRNLPYLRKQLETLIDQGDFEAGLVVLESIDLTPVFESHSKRPMKNLEWACNIMRAFSSMVRQVLTLCNLDIDDRKEREKVDDKGLPKDAFFYLRELLNSCPELSALEKDISACIEESKRGILTKDIAKCLSKTFYLVLGVFDSQQRIPDPRPQYEQDRERMEIRDGFVTRLRGISARDPYAVSVADIKNLRHLPRVNDVFGISYDEALESLLSWVGKKAKSVTENYSDVFLSGLPADNVILAGTNADRVFLSTLDLIKETTQYLASVDSDIFAPLGLLRGGIAWHENAMGNEFKGVRPGIIAHDIGDRPGRERGAIAITRALYDRLSSQYQSEFDETDELSDQGTVFIRHWIRDRDSVKG